MSHSKQVQITDATFCRLKEEGNPLKKGPWDILGTLGRQVRIGHEGSSDGAWLFSWEVEPLPTILGRLRAKFCALESLNFKVGSIHLGSGDIEALQKYPDAYDRESHREILETGRRGVLWGATVWECPEAQPGHVCFIPEGVVVSAIEADSCMPF